MPHCRGARLYLHAVRPRNFLLSADDANRVRGCYQVCFLLSAGLKLFILDVGGGGRPVFSPWEFVRFGDWYSGDQFGPITAGHIVRGKHEWVDSMLQRR